MRLDLFNNASFKRGRPAWVEALWLAAQSALLSSGIPGSRHRVFLLRLFGAKIGEGVVFKPGLRVKFPWRLSVGDYSWIGEEVWIDNLAEVSIGKHACISQGSYFCTGSHDYKSVRFDLITAPIHVGDHVWICAKSTLAPGVTAETGAVLGLGSVATRRLKPWTVYKGSPAREVRERPNSLEDEP